MAPDIARFDIADTRQQLRLSNPLYRAASIEETPYQLLQLCGAQGACRTLADLRGSGGVTMPADPTLGFSPDQRFVLCLRMTALDAAKKAYRSHYYEVYDLGEGVPVQFKTQDGKAATTDNTRGWSTLHPHALEVSAGHKKTALAFPPEAR